MDVDFQDSIPYLQPTEKWRSFPDQTETPPSEILQSMTVPQDMGKTLDIERKRAETGYRDVDKTIRAVLFDLDDTLLVNDMRRFVKEYFDLLTPGMAHLVPPKKFITALLGATYAMMKNRNPAFTNQQVFMDHFFPSVGRTAEEMMPLFEEFYESRFGSLRSLTRPNPAARLAVKTAIDTGCEVVVATNPIFPETAMRQRMDWAGISDLPFRLVTSYEIMHSAKPNPFYYREILKLIGRRPEECVMVGDDWINDMEPAMEVGINVFWIQETAGSKNTPASPPLGPLSDFRDWFLGVLG